MAIPLQDLIMALHYFLCKEFIFWIWISKSRKGCFLYIIKQEMFCPHLLKGALDCPRFVTCDPAPLGGKTWVREVTESSRHSWWVVNCLSLETFKDRQDHIWCRCCRLLRLHPHGFNWVLQKTRSRRCSRIKMGFLELGQTSFLSSFWDLSVHISM